MNIKVINLKSFVEEKSGGKHTSHGPSTMGIIKGPKGTIITFDDAYHDVKSDDNIDINLPVVLNNGQIKLMPEGFAQEPLQDILKHVSTTEQPLYNFIQRFGSRIESNIKMLKKSIEQIGLNPNDFEQ